jgi:hypothetical protein
MMNSNLVGCSTSRSAGLGLSIGHDVIEVDTQPGTFTEIKIILPRTPAFV